MEKRDTLNEVPANFSDFLNLWSLESITCISLNRRLGLLDPNHRDEHAEKLIQVCWILSCPKCSTAELIMKNRIEKQEIQQVLVINRDLRVQLQCFQFKIFDKKILCFISVDPRVFCFIIRLRSESVGLEILRDERFQKIDGCLWWNDEVRTLTFAK